VIEFSVFAGIGVQDTDFGPGKIVPLLRNTMKSLDFTVY